MQYWPEMSCFLGGISVVWCALRKRQLEALMDPSQVKSRASIANRPSSVRESNGPSESAGRASMIGARG
jgi:hypothetical protein